MPTLAGKSAPRSASLSRALKTQPSRPDLDPELLGIGQFVNIYRSAKIVFAAASLDLFTLLEPHPKNLKEICASLKLKARPTEIFLDALVSLGFLRKSNKAYSNATRSSRFLVRGKAGYCGPVLKFQNLLWPAWGELEHVLRSGSPSKNLGHWMRMSPDFTKEYIDCMARISRQSAKEVASFLTRPEDARLLDVGAGPGTFSLAMLERNPRLQAVLLDLPATLRITKEFIARHPARDRISLKPGNYHALRLKANSFDLILLSHMTHNEGPQFSRKVLSACFEALRPGGRIAVHDFMTDPDGTTPKFCALFAVHMTVFTDEGAVYRAEQYQSWMREAGLTDLRKETICGDTENLSQLLTGKKA